MVTSASAKGEQWQRGLRPVKETPADREPGVAAAAQQGLPLKYAPRWLQVDVITYNVTVSASGTGKQRRRALALLDETHPQGIQANVITYNATPQARPRPA